MKSILPAETLVDALVELLLDDNNGFRDVMTLIMLRVMEAFNEHEDEVEIFTSLWIELTESTGIQSWCLIRVHNLTKLCN